MHAVPNVSYGTPSPPQQPLALLNGRVQVRLCLRGSGKRDENAIKERKELTTSSAVESHFALGLNHDAMEPI